MKYAGLFLMKVMFITVPFVGQGQEAECKSISKILNEVNNNFKRGIHIYSPRRVKTQIDSVGTKYNIKGRNKDIEMLIKVTNIKCIEDIRGRYLITKEILDAWNDWLIRNCRKKE